MTDKKIEKEEKEEELTRAQKIALRQQKRAQKRRERKEKIKQMKPWHPLRILRGIGLFFLYLIKIIFFPYVYAYWKIRDTYKFLTRNDKEDLDRLLLSEENDDTIPEGYIDEKKFLKSLPVFYFFAGTLGAIIAIFIAFPEVRQAIADFFINFSWATAWALFVDILEAFFVELIYNSILKPVGNGIWIALTWLFAGERFWVPLTILLVLGFVIIVLAIIFSEVDFSGKIWRKIKAFFVAIFTFPKVLWKWIKIGYKAFKNGIARFTLGKTKLEFYSKRFFYRIIIYSTITTMWIVVTIITLVIVNAVVENGIQNEELVFPVTLLLIGFANGFLLLAFLSWFIGLLSKEKYIVNPDKYTKYIEEKQKAKEEKRKKRIEKSAS